MQTVTELLSGPKRKAVYIVYAIIGVVFGGIQTAFTSAELESPLWLTVALSVYLYVGGAFGLLAAQNVGAKEVIINAVDTPQVTTDDVYLGKHGEVEDVRVYDTEPETPFLDVPEIK